MTRQSSAQAPGLSPQRRQFGCLSARCSRLALALATALPLTAGPAAAQGFLGSGVFTTGSGSILTNTNITLVTSDTPQAVIDWTTAQGGPAASFNFLPAGNQVRFDGPTNSPTNYTILNRINSNFGTPVIELNGSIFSNFNAAPGGTIWFQAPGGFLVGPSAVINVANLMLTPGVVDTTGGLLGPGGTIRINTAADSIAKVRIESGASIASTTNNSYVAIVAPRIEQLGTINTDGSTALIAAEQVTFSVNGGLFDISVAVGTTDTNGIAHSGTTGGPASTSAADIQRVAMVAVAKNTAMTMLLSGTIGYLPASSAFQEGSAVQLSGGYNIAGDSIGTRASTATTQIAIGDALIRNTVGNQFSPSRASGFVTMSVSPSNSLRFAGDVFLSSDEAVFAGVDANETMQFDGNAFFSAGSGFTGGLINFTSFGGTITAAGNLNLDARPPAGFLNPQGIGANATGGSIIVDARGGSISAGAALIANAGARGDDNFTTGIGGDGFGGTVNLSVSSGGTLGFAAVDLSARGAGGSAFSGTGGSGHGGAITISEQGGLLDFGDLSLIVESVGGFGPVGGDAIGGRVLIDIATSAQSWNTLFVFAGVFAAGFDGTNLSGSATADADAIRLNITGPGSLQLATFTSLDAYAQAERGVVQGATVTGGGITINVDNGAAIGGTSSFFANAGAFLNSDTIPISGDFSPAVRGGTINFAVTNGATLDLSDIELRSTAEGAIANLAAGSATGGSITVSAQNGATFELEGVSGQPQLTMEAYALGNNGVASANAFGGTVRLFASDSVFAIPGLVRLDAGARLGFESDGSQGPGANVTGGSALVEILAGANGTGALDFDTLVLLADGSPDRIMDAPDAFPSVNGDGGNGTGGSATVRQFAGTFSVADLNLNVEGHGGLSDESLRPLPFTSGTGTSGTALFQQNGGNAAIGNFTIDANAFGGGTVNAANAGLPSIGGNAVGGNVQVQLLGGNFALSQQFPLIIAANATGGRGMSGTASAGNGGSATGGLARFSTGGAATSILIPASVIVTADARGGDSGAIASGLSGIGGSATGGTASFQIAASALSLGNVLLSANGRGGAGDTAGAGTGGAGLFGVNDSTLPPSPSLPAGYARTIAGLAIDANGVAGAGRSVSATGTNGTVALSVVPGTAQGALNVTGDLNLNATGAVPGGTPAISITTAQQPFRIGGNAVLNGTSGISFAMGAGAPLTINGLLDGTSQGLISSTGPIVTGSSTTLSGDGGISLQTLTSGDTTSFTSVSGAVSVTNDLRSTGLVTANGQTILLNSLGSLGFDRLTSTVGGTTINLAGNGQFNGPAAVSTAANVTLGGIATISGAFDAQAISIVSSDIALGANAQLGSLQRTGSILLQASQSSSPMFVGGGDQQGGYSLSNAEFGRLRSLQTIEIVKPDGPIQGGALNASALQGGQLGPDGMLIIRSGTRINVTGAIDFAAGNGNAGVFLQGGEVFVDASTGGVAVHDASGGLQGVLSFSGSAVLVGRGSSFQAPPANNSLGQIGSLLDQPLATPNDAGAISAGEIRANVSSGFYIQNSGASTAYADRRGFTARQFSIDTSGQGPVDIAVNGRVVNPQGGFFTGLDTTANLRINELPGGVSLNGLSTLSSVNGCQLGGACNVVPPPSGIPSLPPGALPPQDTIAAIVESVSGSGQAIFQLTPIELGETVVLDATPLVDEPVTSVGNEDLWERSCDAEGGQGCSSPED